MQGNVLYGRISSLQEAQYWAHLFFQSAFWLCRGPAVFGLGVGLHRLLHWWLEHPLCLIGILKLLQGHVWLQLHHSRIQTSLQCPLRFHLSQLNCLKRLQVQCSLLQAFSWKFQRTALFLWKAHKTKVPRFCLQALWIWLLIWQYLLVCLLPLRWIQCPLFQNLSMK